MCKSHGSILKDKAGDIHFLKFFFIVTKTNVVLSAPIPLLHAHTFNEAHVIPLKHTGTVVFTKHFSIRRSLFMCGEYFLQRML